MPRPTYSAPELPKQRTPIPGLSGKCGMLSWKDMLDVRVPYRGIDRYTITFEKLANLDAGSDDLNVAIPLLWEGIHSGRFRDTAYNAKQMVKDLQNSGHMDAKNAEAIYSILFRALRYLTQARSIWDFWETEYRPEIKKHVPWGWPLTKSEYLGCAGKVAPDKTSTSWTEEGGAKRGTVDFLCPSQEDKDNHAFDRQRFRDLAYAGMVQLRCAQEGIGAVGTYNQNRAHAPPGELMRVAAREEEERKPFMIAVAEEVEPEPEAEPEAEPELAPAAPKKKSNIGLILGAAALGIIVMKK